MSFVAAAVTTGVGLAGQVAGSAMQSSAAGHAAELQGKAAQQANDIQKGVYGDIRTDNQPYMDAGKGALSQMQDPYFQHNFGAADFQADPGYAFRLQQGQQALERSAAARGGLQSGGTLKGLTDYAQGMASNEYQNAYNRFTNDQSQRFGRLSTLAGMGQNAVGMVGSAGQHYADQAGNNLTGSANAQGAAGIAGANGWANTLSGLGGAVGNTWMGAKSMNNTQNWLNAMLPQQPSLTNLTAANNTGYAQPGVVTNYSAPIGPSIP